MNEEPTIIWNCVILLVADLLEFLDLEIDAISASSFSANNLFSRFRCISSSLFLSFSS